MPQEQGYERMEELAGRLRDGLSDLGDGRLDIDGVDRMVEDARQLFERLVVLRHKAREQVNAGHERQRSLDADPIRLATRPQDAAPGQTSLIDAIAETEHQEPPPPALLIPPTPMRGRKALAKVITLSEKFRFLKELFANDAQRYEAAIAALDQAEDLSAARTLMMDLVVVGNKPPAEDALQALSDALQRAFPA